MLNIQILALLLSFYSAFVPKKTLSKYREDQKLKIGPLLVMVFSQL